MNKKQIFVVYHAKCTDGLFAAASVKMYLDPFYENKADIKYIPMDYDESENFVANNAVVIAVDFSFSSNKVRELLDNNNSLLIIDHHKSAFEKLIPVAKELDIDVVEDIDSFCDKAHWFLEDLTKCNLFVFNKEHSGATLAFRIFRALSYNTHDVPEERREKEIPLALQYVEDRDLWKKQLPNTDAVSAYLKSEVNSINDAYSLILRPAIGSGWFKDAVSKGEYILKGLDSVTESQLESSLHCVMFSFTEAYIRSLSPFLLTTFLDLKKEYGRKATLIDDNVEGIVIPACMMPGLLASDACVEIMQFTGTNLSATYNIESSGSIKWSFRSRNTGQGKAYALASILGGGGHLNSGGAYTRLGKQAETSFFFGTKSLRLVQIFRIGE